MQLCLCEAAVAALKLAFEAVRLAAQAAIWAAGEAVSFFGEDIETLVPELKGIRNPPRPDNSARAQAMGRKKRAYEKRFKLKLDKYTEEIDLLIDRQRKYRKAKNKVGYQNITRLIKKKAAERDKFKKEGYKRLKRMRVT